MHIYICMCVYIYTYIRVRIENYYMYILHLKMFTDAGKICIILSARYSRLFQLFCCS